MTSDRPGARVGTRECRQRHRADDCAREYTECVVFSNRLRTASSDTAAAGDGGGWPRVGALGCRVRSTQAAPGDRDPRTLNALG